MTSRLLQYIPHGNTLDEAAWRKRHDLLSLLLLLHVPGLLLFGLAVGHSLGYTAWAFGPPFVLLVAGRLARNRRVASFFVTVGLVYCSAALVGLSRGSIEAHFHFFIIIGFIALYQDWVPFLWNIAFTVLSHGLGSGLQKNLIFNHPAGQGNPWLWSAIHGLAVMFACGGVVIFWRANEREQQKTLKLATELADAEVTHRRFTSELLVNLARRNQSLLYRQLRVINQLEDQEKDPDALADLFHLDHLATRIRRNAESLLVLSGEQPPRVWSRPVPLLDVVRAAIAETDDLDRVVFNVDERATVSGNAVADLTHMLAELVENAVRFSPPETSVSVRTRPHLQHAGGWVLTVEDWGVGLPAEDLAAANQLLAAPGDVDLSVSQRLGLHVIARLAQRYGVQVSLSATPGGGITAVVVLPADLFSEGDAAPAELAAPVAEPAAAAVEPAAPVAEPAAAAVEPAAREAVPVPSLASFGAGSPPAPNGGVEEPAWQGWWQPPAGGHLADLPAAPGPPDGPGAELHQAGRQAPDPGPKDVPAASLPAEDRQAPEWPAANLPAADEPIADRPAPRRSLRPALPAAALAWDGTEAAGQAVADPAGTPPLTRRVPQSHLAPELRRHDGAAAPSAVTPPAQRLPNAAQARAALARYQASRAAARAVVEDRSASERP